MPDSYQSPRFGLTSRFTVDGDRPSRTAIERIDSLAAIPLEISSRSTRVSARDDRQRDCGRMPPYTAS